MGSMVSRPQRFISRPWYRLTVAVQAKATISFSDLQEALNTQLFGKQSPDGIVVEARLQSVRYWAQFPTTASTPTIGQASLQVNDPLYFTSNLERALTVVSGFPDQVNRVALGYNYSVAQRNFACQLTGTANVVRTSGAGLTGVLYFDLLWRPDVIAPPGELVTSYPPLQPVRRECDCLHCRDGSNAQAKAFLQTAGAKQPVFPLELSCSDTQSEDDTE